MGSSQGCVFSLFTFCPCLFGASSHPSHCQTPHLAISCLDPDWVIQQAPPTADRSCLGHMWGSTWPAVLSGRVLLTPLCFPPSAIMSLTTRWPSCRNGTMRALVLCSGGPKVIKGRGRACVWGWVSGWQRLNTAWGVFCFASALFPASPLATCLALPACLTPAPLPASPLASFLLYPSSP